MNARYEDFMRQIDVVAHQVEALRALGAQLALDRIREEPFTDRSLASIVAERQRERERWRRESQESDEAAMNMGGTPCGDIHPDYEACTHECCLAPDVVDRIEACGE